MSTSLELTNAPRWVQALSPASPQGPELISLERSKSNVSVSALSELLFTAPELEMRRRVVEILSREPVFDKSRNYFEGREEKFKMALERGKRLRQLQVEHGWDHMTYQVASAYLGEPNPYGLHNRWVCPKSPATAAARSASRMAG
jgi:acyl-CoA oxidase